MINLGDAVLFFRGDMNDLDRALGDARSAAEQNLGNMKQMAQEVGMAMTAMGAAILGGLGTTVYGFANTADDINDLSTKIGFSTETVSRWAFALGQSGGDVGLLQTGVRSLAIAIESNSAALDDANEKFQQELPEASKKGAEAVYQLQQRLFSTNDVFSRLGFSVEQLKSLQPEKQFEVMAFAVAKIEDPMERVSIAQQVFGKAGMDLLPVLAEGEEGLRRMFDEADRAGVVFSSAEAALGDEFNDAVGATWATLRGIGYEIAKILIPVLIDMLDWVKRNAQVWQEWMKTNSDIAKSLVLSTAAIGGFLAVTGPAVGYVGSLATITDVLSKGVVALAAALGITVGTAAAWVAAIVAAVAAIGYAAYSVYQNWDSILGFFSDFWPNLTALFNSGKQAIADSDIFQTLREGATYSVEYVVSEMGSLAGWLVGNFAQAITDPVSFISDIWTYLSDIFTSVVSNIGAAIFWLLDNVIEPAWQSLKEFYSWITDVFYGAFEAAANSGFGQMLIPEPIPGMATGGTVAKGGLSWVGERGPEIVYMPTGAQVIPADQSAAIAAGAGTTVNISFGSVQVPDRAAANYLARALGEELTRRVSARGLRGAV